MEAINRNSFTDFIRACAIQSFENDLVKAVFQSGFSYGEVKAILESVSMTCDVYKNEFKTK